MNTENVKEKSIKARIHEAMFIKDPELAKKEMIKWTIKAAELGHVESLPAAGAALYAGDGVEQNKKEAARFWRMGALRGCRASMFELGYLYYCGEGVKQSHAMAAKLWRLAAVRGCDLSMLRLAQAYLKGEGVEQDEDAAEDWYYLAMDGVSPSMRSTLKRLARLEW